MRRAAREQGFALLAVLWAAMMLAIIVASLLTSGRTEALIARNRARAAAQEAIADAAINAAILRMLNPDPAMQPPTDGTAFRIDFAGAPVRVVVQDEAGKIDLNRADGSLLARLLEVAGLGGDDAQAMADRIQDWRDPSGLHRLNGADEAAYAAAGAGYGPRRGPFPSVEELRLVAGMDPRVFARIAPSLTVASDTPWVDPSFAGHDVLLALPGATEASVAAALAARAAARLPGVVTGHAFSITAEADEAGVRMVRCAVIRLTGNRTVPVWVYSWDRVSAP